MNWAAISFDWNQARAFLATAEEGSLSAGARALGLTQPTLGRQVTALEEHLGVMLFERGGRTMTLTEAGHELIEHFRAMGTAAERVSLTATGQSQAVEGHVAITATDIVISYLMPGVLHALRARAPGIEVDLIAANDLRDLRRREADIALRNVRPEDPELIAKRLREVPIHLYAMPAYLDRNGRPEIREDLAQHDFISMGNPGEFLSILNAHGVPVTRARMRYGSESALLGWTLMQQGLGIAPMSEDIASLTPGVERLAVEMDPLLVPIWLTTHRELHTSRRIRLVFDLLAETLGRP
ncbi:MAG: LysR family transcriptional regulator [Pseudomonadota bacterium]